jgi:hypothetical protein
MGQDGKFYFTICGIIFSDLGDGCHNVHGCGDEITGQAESSVEEESGTPGENRGRPVLWIRTGFNADPNEIKLFTSKGSAYGSPLSQTNADLCGSGSPGQTLPSLKVELSREKYTLCTR